MSTPGQPPSGGFQGGSYPQQPGGYPQDPYSGGMQPGYPPATGPQGQPGGGPPGQYYQPTAGHPQSGYPPSGYPQPGYPPPGYPPPGYPPAAYPGTGYPGYDQPAIEQPSRPTSVTAAFWCWMLSVAAVLLNAFILLTSDVWGQALTVATSGSGVVVDAQSLVSFVRTVTIITAVVIVGLYLLFAFKMYTGRNWARITLTVLGALNLISTISPATTSVTINDEVFRPNPIASYIAAALVAAAIVLMFIGGANEFFSRSRQFRQQPLR